MCATCGTHTHNTLLQDSASIQECVYFSVYVCLRLRVCTAAGVRTVSEKELNCFVWLFVCCVFVCVFCVSVCLCACVRVCVWTVAGVGIDPGTDISARALFQRARL